MKTKLLHVRNKISKKKETEGRKGKEEGSKRKEKVESLQRKTGANEIKVKELNKLY